MNALTAIMIGVLASWLCLVCIFAVVSETLGDPAGRRRRRVINIMHGAITASCLVGTIVVRSLAA